MSISHRGWMLVLSFAIIASLLSLALLAVIPCHNTIAPSLQELTSEVPEAPGERTDQADDSASRRVDQARVDVVSEVESSRGKERSQDLGRETFRNSRGAPAGRQVATREMPHVGWAKSPDDAPEDDEAISEGRRDKKMVFELNRLVAGKLEECYDSWSSWADDARGTLIMNITYCPLPDGAKRYAFLTASVVEASFDNQFFRSCVENSVRTALVPVYQGPHEQYCASEPLTTRYSFRFGHHVPEEVAGDSSDDLVVDGQVPEPRKDDERKQDLEALPDERAVTGEGVTSSKNR